MVRADIIDFIDRILRVYSRNFREPFGGKQLLLVGDVFQLEPVLKSDERDILSRFYPTPYFFSAYVFREMELVSIELHKVYRQSDPVFVGVLNRIRTNTAGVPDLQLLNTRVDSSDEKTDDMRITLATRRDQVDYINDKRLAELEGDPVILTGEIKGEFPTNSLPTALELQLKPGAQIIFIKNDPDKRWVNGTIGVVSGLDEESGIIYVITDDGREYDVRREVWSNIRYTYNEEEKRIEEEELGTFTQFPSPAGLGHHHTQKPRAHVQPREHRLHGRRLRRRTGLCRPQPVHLARRHHLRKPVTRSDIFVRPEIVRFAEKFNNRQAIDRALRQAQADVLYVQAVRAFDDGDFDTFLDAFFRAIHARYDIEKPSSSG